MSKHKFNFSRLCHQAKKGIIKTSDKAANDVAEVAVDMSKNPWAMFGGGAAAGGVAVGATCKALGFKLSTGDATVDAAMEDAYDLLLASDPESTEAVAADTGLSVEEVEAIAVLARAGTEVA